MRLLFCTGIARTFPLELSLETGYFSRSMFRRTFASLVPSLAAGLVAMAAAASVFAEEESFKPTWETQRLARTYVQNIPAPRGQILDRNGEPLAQNRLCFNLGINFPTPLEFTNAAAIAFARAQIARAERLTGRKASVTDEAIVKHYANRGILPLDIFQDLNIKEQESIGREGGEGLVLHPIYVRIYPNGSLAAHILGYAGRAGRMPDGPIQNNDLLWPEAEGREGLELTFNEQLTGKPGQVTYNFDAQGKKVSEKITAPPEPGFNVVTTLDVKLQRICEKVLSQGCKRGAMVFMDPNSGDILAMASWPTFDPNAFIPVISQEDFKALNEDPNLPLLPRTFRSAYPPGSTFKVFVGVAALESHKITLEQEFSGPPALTIGNLVMHNWKKTDAGMLNFAAALEQSCDTWFYQVGIKTGARPLVEWALKFGFSSRTGIPLRSEVEGSIPTDEYLQKHKLPRLGAGGLANISIGQGDVLVTPLQMAQAMAIVAGGGTFYQTRLVQQVQGLDDAIVTGYEPRLRDELEMTPEILAELKKAMVAVVSGGHGTAHKAAVEGVEVAGKTGTAQWGPKNAERYAAWFAGFAPAEKPKYAFAALYESDPGQREAHGGTVAAPLIGKVLREVCKQEPKAKRKKRKKTDEDQEDAPKKAEPKPSADEQSGD